MKKIYDGLLLLPSGIHSEIVCVFAISFYRVLMTIVAFSLGS